jgi:hypothetical protein
MDMQTVRSPLAFIMLSLSVGCASLSGSHEHYYACSYEVVWDAAIDILKPHSITSQNKERGVIETAWIEMEGKERTFGAFGREGFGNRERARLTATIKRMDDVAAVSMLETRQRWHAKGGVTQQATKWWPVDPSEEVMKDLTDRLNSKLQEKGCSAS